MLSGEIDEGLSDSQAVRKERERRMRSLLDARTPRASVSELAQGTGWTEEVVLETLKALIEQDLWEEDLDLDSGLWFYKPHEEYIFELEEADSRSLSERMEQSQHKRTT